MDNKWCNRPTKRSESGSCVGRSFYVVMTSLNGNKIPHYWPFVRGIHWSPVNSPHKGQWHETLMFSLISAWINTSKQSWGWWFETSSHSLWRHCNVKWWNQGIMGHYGISEQVAFNSLAPGKYNCKLKCVIFNLISNTDIFSISCEIVLRWMPQDFADY